MLKLFVLSFIVIGLAVTGMAIGVIVRHRAIKGSCGGLNNIEGLGGVCEVCSDEGQCRNERKRLSV